MSFPAAAAVGFTACGALAAAVITLAVCHLQSTKREPIDDEAQAVVPTEPQVVVPPILGHPGIRYMSASMLELRPVLTGLAEKLRLDIDEMVEGCCLLHQEKGPVDISLPPLIAAAGDGEDWEELLNHPVGRRWGLQALVMRVIARWMDPEGDPDHTLIPPDLLRLYQTSISKPGEDPGLQAALTAWPRITFNLISKATPQFGLVTDNQFADGDPRLPNVLKLEELLAQLLEPFGPTTENLIKWFPEEEERKWEGNIRSQNGHSYLRQTTIDAANLALACFAGDNTMAEVRFPPGRASSATDRRIMVFPAIGRREDTAPNADETAGVPEPGAAVGWRELARARFSLQNLAGLWYLGPLEDSSVDHSPRFLV